MPAFFFPPVPLIRKNVILRKLTAAGAVSPETAVTFREAGVINPDLFPAVTRSLIKLGKLVKTADDKYYIAK